MSAQDDLAYMRTVIRIVRAEWAAGEETLAAEDGVVVADGQDALGKAQHRGGFFFLQHGPVHP